MRLYTEHQLAARSRAGTRSLATINAVFPRPKPAAAEQQGYLGHGEGSAALTRTHVDAKSA